MRQKVVALNSPPRPRNMLADVATHRTSEPIAGCRAELQRTGQHARKVRSRAEFVVGDDNYSLGAHRHAPFR